MSIPVELEALHAQVLAYGSAPLLITVGDDGRPHAVSVAVGWDGGVMTAAAGGRTKGNCGLRPDVALVFPAVEAGGYLLIVDAVAATTDDGVRLTPLKAVLHRNAAGPTDADCGHDCRPVLG
jgi:hypothetical protein